MRSALTILSFKATTKGCETALIGCLEGGDDDG
jgi:hypothetical protein